MKSRSSYKKRSRPINLTGDHSGHGKGIVSTHTRQLLRLEEKINQSDRVRNLGRLQLKANAFTSQQSILESEKLAYNDAAYLPSQNAAIHVHEYPKANRNVKGYLNLGGTHIKVNSYFSALEALKSLQANPGVPGFDEMEYLLKGWLDEFNPSIENTNQDPQVKKKHEDHQGEEKATGQD